MFSDRPGLMSEIRNKFAHVESCPFEGERIFFENAGGALTLKSVVETSARFAAIPDNQGRANGASAKLMEIISKAKEDTKTFFGASSGQIFVGESGTELLFRLIRTAAAAHPCGVIAGSTVEHPASRSACARWSEVLDMPYVQVPHNVERGLVTADEYAAHIPEDTVVATILHTSPVSGMGNDVAAIARTIRAKAPGAYIIVDGIQHACHGGIDIDSYDIDGYVISPYKVFSRHGYGVAWISDRLSALSHEALVGGPETAWEFGTRDTGSYATFSDVVAYFDWLGAQISTSETPRGRIIAAGDAIKKHEAELTEILLIGTGNHVGLSHLPGVTILGGSDNPAREGLVSFALDGMSAAQIVDQLNKQGIRTHTRKPDHYSGNILKPLNLDGCVRVSLCHYNTKEEVVALLDAVAGLA